MSKNAARKRYDKRRHRDKFSRLPTGTPLAHVVTMITPAKTPFLTYIEAFRAKHG